jgi:glycogen phosphorylase
LAEVSAKWPGDDARLARMSIVEEGASRQVRMAYLSIVGSHSVNGVAAVHSDLVTKELVPDFHALWPERFNNKTNGVTPRRWLLASNPKLASLITENIGDGWVTDLSRLRALEPKAGDAAFRDRFRAIKRENKQRLAEVVKKATGQTIDCDTLFDIHVKRIHEYKRQLLNVLHIAHDYLRFADNGIAPSQPRTYVFAGKAAPGYHVAKEIIRLIHDVGRVINGDRRVKELMRVVFIPDYRVSLAEVIIPAADLSEQISTAGMEASGTGNMKFAMNGALTIGTLDGANIEIRQEVGPENIFIFGLTVDEIRRMHRSGPYVPREICDRSPAVRQVMDAFQSSRFCPDATGRHRWVYDKLLANDERYLHLADLESYLATHEQASALYRTPDAWASKAILNVARIGTFSSDRTIQQYADDIWTLKAVPPTG